MRRMEKRPGSFHRFSHFCAFGAGVAVGANWPRTSNFIGNFLQRLGFELTDLVLWVWDPEKDFSSGPARLESGSRTGSRAVPAHARASVKRKISRRARAAGLKSQHPVQGAAGKMPKDAAAPERGWIRSRKSDLVNGRSGSNGRRTTTQSGRALTSRRWAKSKNSSFGRSSADPANEAGPKASKRSAERGKRKPPGKAQKFPPPVPPAPIELN